MKTHFDSTIIMVLFFVLFSIFGRWGICSEPDHFQKYSYPADGFEVLFPQKPLMSMSKHKGPDGGYSNSYQALVVNPFSQYSVFVSHSEKRVFDDAAIKEYLKGIVRGLLIGSEKAKLLSQKEIIFNGFAGIEYRFSSKVEGFPAIAHGIVFLIDGEHIRLSQIVLQKDLNADNDFQRFINSFRLLPIEAPQGEDWFVDSERGISFRPPEGWRKAHAKFPVVASFSNPGGHSISVLDSGSPGYLSENYMNELQNLQGIESTGTFNLKERTVTWYRSTTFNPGAGIRLSTIHYCIDTTKGAVIMIGSAPEKTFFRSERIFEIACKSLLIRK